MEDLFVEGGSVFGVDTRRATGEDDTRRVLQKTHVGVWRQDLGPDIESTHAVGDEMGVLAAEVEDDDAAAQSESLPRGEGAPPRRQLLGKPEYTLPANHSKTGLRRRPGSTPDRSPASHPDRTPQDQFKRA